MRGAVIALCMLGCSPAPTAPKPDAGSCDSATQSCPELKTACEKLQRSDFLAAPMACLAAAKSCTEALKCTPVQKELGP